MNYWIKSVDELTKLAEEKGIKEKDLPKTESGTVDHKFLARMLTNIDAQEGDLTEAVIIDADDSGKPAADVVKENTKQKTGAGWIDIVFHNQDGSTKYVFLGLNGRSLILPREVPCRIPAEFLGVVKSAVQTKIVQTPGEGNKIVTKSVKVPRFSYEVLARGN